MQDGREALRGILSKEGHAEMVKRSVQGTTHGGASISTPGFKRLFHMRQYESEQPQFIHRWLLKEFLTERMNIKRGRKAVRVENVSKEMGQAEIIFDDDTSDKADLVVGKSIGSSWKKANVYRGGWSGLASTRTAISDLRRIRQITIHQHPDEIDYNGS